jgi:molybdopterin/thiamine biosynthesis adenylyltransferase
MWSYEQGFQRNLGLISSEEQAKLRSKRVAIAGQGGVGGVHAVALARLGIGHFTIADPDVFDVANANRQYGSFASTWGRNKATVMAEILRDINPDVDVRVFPERIDESNVEAFLDGADLFLDGIDAFELPARRLLFKKASEKRLFAVTAGPIGFSTAWLVFAPDGMSFEKYFDFKSGMDSSDEFAAFLVGLVPRATHRGYIDMSYVNLKDRTGPSASLACHLAAGVATGEILKILLKRGEVRAAPWFHQFDIYRYLYRSQRLWGGNRHPLQRMKRWILARRLRG